MTAEISRSSGHESLIGPDRIQGENNLEPGVALTFMALRSMATSDSTVTVTWESTEDGQADRQAWQYPLPAKPRA